MREFRRNSGTLSRVPRAGRLLYAAFLGFVLLAFCSSVALYWEGLGLDLGQHAAHYLGNADDPDATRILLEKSPRELLEVSHFHLYTMPVLLLVLAHLFLLSRGGAWKHWVVGTAVVTTLLHVAGPWLIHFGGAGQAWIMPVSGVPFLASYLVMALWPLPELLGSPASAAGPAED